MNFKGIPVHSVGPGSQPTMNDDESLSYISMPNDMSTYRPPLLPEPEAITGWGDAQQAMSWLQKALASYSVNAPPQLANLTALDPESRELVNQILGEGEVSITCTGMQRARCQEAVLAGVWRVLYLDSNERVIADLLEVADVPHLLNQTSPAVSDIDITNVPDGIMNALPILVELSSALERYRDATTTHVINLSLLPLSDADLQFLDDRLGRGDMDILSRAYGKCQVSSTATPNLWWVRYYNSMGVLILNTLEVVDVPAVVRAAPEDLADSAVRLDDILAPYWSDVA